MSIIPSHQDEILFEPRDTEIFKIPDIKTKIATVQNYFFPRLEYLLRETLDIITRVHEVNPYERISFVYRPSNRKTAKENYDFSEVYIGISGKKTNTPLNIKRENGNSFFYHPTYLIYRIGLNGEISVELRPFIYYVDERFVSSMRQLIQDNIDALLPILALQNIGYHSGIPDLKNLVDCFVHNHLGIGGVRLYSPTYYFPVDVAHGLHALIMAFVALYPFVDASISLAEGKKPQFEKCLKQYKAAWISAASRQYDEDRIPDHEQDTQQGADMIAPQLPELESYTFVRAGVWWAVLARDNWTCCSCGRTPKDGVTLEVDHILPRSKGGTNDIDNLQTLCKKCNIGKSTKPLPPGRR